MSLKEFLRNGVLILHKVEDGKHEYEVKIVVQFNKSSWKKVFASGDKLTHINGKDLQDVAPEELAEMLAERNPMLTVHKPGKKKVNPGEEAPPSEETLQPFSKEYTTMTFDWEMTRGEEGELCQQEEQVEADTELEYKDLLVIEMTKTSISVVRGRGCDTSSPCKECNGSGCHNNDVVVTTESSQVTVGGATFDCLSDYTAWVQHVFSGRYLRCHSSQKTVYASINKESITIYNYKSTNNDSNFRGIPVVLNLTGSNFFLKCSCVDQTVTMKMEVFDKEKLKKISRSDHTTLCYVFYMRGDHSNQKTFESALHKGWFININVDTVQMTGKLVESEDEESFYFVIHHEK